MNKKLTIETIAFVLLIVAFPVTSAGTHHDNTAVWILGLLCLIVAGVLPVWTRFMDHSTDKARDMGLEYDERAS
jgi:peptidoglycan/LPS O-acetylase OafA/YrhL